MAKYVDVEKVFCADCEDRDRCGSPDVFCDVHSMPAADVAPVVHGEWQEKFFTNERQRVCSVCHCTVRQPSYDKGETALFKFCPHCGATMYGERKGDDDT